MTDKTTLQNDRGLLIAELEAAGAKFKGNSCNCPFHDDHHPSAGIYCKDGAWRFKCQKCGVGGDLFDIRAKIKGTSPAEELKAIGGHSGAKSGGGKGNEPPPAVYPTLEAVRVEILKQVQGTIESEHSYGDLQGTEVLRIFRCWTNAGKVFRPVSSLPGGYVLKALMTPRPIYSLPEIVKAEMVVVVEGEKCADALRKYGFCVTTSPFGAKSAGQADWTALAGKIIILWPDNDLEGHEYMRQVAAILEQLDPPAKISIINPCDLDLIEKEDCADFISQLKLTGKTELEIKRALLDAIGRAKAKSITAGVQELIEKSISGQRQAIAWGWGCLDAVSQCLLPESIVLLCGGIGASKSFMLLEALQYWHSIGIKVACYELEKSQDFHLMRVLAQRAENANLTQSKWIAENPEPARQAYKDHTDFLESFGHCIYANPDEQLTLEQVAAWMLQRAKAGCRIICVDPVTAAMQTKEPWIADSIFLQKARRVAVDYQCSIVLVTHPTKTVSFPNIDQLAGGASYGRFSDNVLWLEAHDRKPNTIRTCLGRDDIEHNRTLHLLKIRDGEGQGLTVAYEFQRDNLRLRELGLIIRQRKQKHE